MKRHHKTIANTTLVVAILAIGYFYVLYDKIYLSDEIIEMKDNLTVRHFDKGFDLDVNAPFWENVKAEKIQLYPQAAKSPYGTSEKELWVKAAYNEEEIAFLIQFMDNTKDLGTPANPDACAILLTTEDAPATAQMMGYESKANVWQFFAFLEPGFTL